MTQELLYTIALTRVLPMNATVQNILINEFGSAAGVFENRNDLRSILPDSTDRLLTALAQMEQHLSRAEQEIAFAEKNRIECLLKTDERYPTRLKNCGDAPILLFYRGSANLNATRIISMVGTRHCTEYGKDFCRHFLEDMSQICPDVLVVSGLAYGIDINSHRQALANGLDTIGVLAHGLDQIYPRIHRQTAVEMVTHGGLLTEFMSGSTAEKVNFISRNRIVAGMADATIVVESKSKGGSLITAGIANDYNRDVFAVPGRVGDELSEGCNRLIHANQALLLQNAEDFVTTMGWSVPQQKKQPVQRQMFLDLSPEETQVANQLKDSDGKDLNQLTLSTGLPVARLSAILFELELKGVVKMLQGSRYRLL